MPFPQPAKPLSESFGAAVPLAERPQIDEYRESLVPVVVRLIVGVQAQDDFAVRRPRAGGVSWAVLLGYLYAKDNGSYCRAGRGNELFPSDAKFASRTGWPSFSQPAGEAAVELRTGKGWLLRRTEVVCRRCGGHLSHVFRDDLGRVFRNGPAPTRRRYCINSCALSFETTPPDRDRSDGQPGH